MDGPIGKSMCGLGCGDGKSLSRGLTAEIRLICRFAFAGVMAVYEVGAFRSVLIHVIDALSLNNCNLAPLLLCDKNKVYTPLPLLVVVACAI